MGVWIPDGGLTTHPPDRLAVTSANKRTTHADVHRSPKARRCALIRSRSDIVMPPAIDSYYQNFPKALPAKVSPAIRRGKGPSHLIHGCICSLRRSSPAEHTHVVLH